MSLLHWRRVNLAAACQRSVTRAFDQEHIDAELTVWDVIGRLPTRL